MGQHVPQDVRSQNNKTIESYGIHMENAKGQTTKRHVAFCYQEIHLTHPHLSVQYKTLSTHSISFSKVACGHLWKRNRKKDLSYAMITG